MNAPSQKENSAEQPITILKVDASARTKHSTSRALNNALLKALGTQFANINLIRRDVAPGIPLVNEAWVNANLTPAENRTEEQKNALTISDELVDELILANYILISTPIYNFSVPASLKSWIDQVCRAQRTFRYTSEGPIGLLTGKRVFVTISSAGTQLDSEIDFAGRYLRHVLGFIGLEDVLFIRADAQGAQAQSKIREALVQIKQIVAETCKDPNGG